MPVAILNPQRLSLPLRLLRRVARAALAAEGRAGVELSLVYCDTETITTLNRDYRRADCATDVLAFPQEGGPGGEDLLGDVVVCVPVAEQQAVQAGWSRDDELALLTLHGVLHLLGYRDEQADEREQMRRREDQLFQAILGRPVLRLPEEAP